MLKSFAFIHRFTLHTSFIFESPCLRVRPSRILLLLSAILLFGCTERQVRIHFEQAEKYRHEGKIDLAIEEYKAILGLRPDAIDALNNLGYLYVGKGQYANAIAQYQKAIAVKPDFAEAHFNLGVAYVAHSQLDSAIAAYQRALQYDPENHEIHNNLGAAYT
ncbi:MAG: tetratricopeptide repeat protein, partial [Gemmatimonadetes bacterium]|nr:tetratricopeptide repeat protein [Gemmatimonadota bacterium]